MRRAVAFAAACAVLAVGAGVGGCGLKFETVPGIVSTSGAVGFWSEGLSEVSDDSLLGFGYTLAGAAMLGVGALWVITVGDGDVSALEPRRRDVAIDIARGYGPWIDDLTAALGAPPAAAARVGAALRASRGALVARDALGAEVFDADAGGRFALRVAAALHRDPVLAPLVVAAAARGAPARP